MGLKVARTWPAVKLHTLTVPSLLDEAKILSIGREGHAMFEFV